MRWTDPVPRPRPTSRRLPRHVRRYEWTDAHLSVYGSDRPLINAIHTRDSAVALALVKKLLKAGADAHVEECERP